MQLVSVDDGFVELHPVRYEWPHARPSQPAGEFDWEANWLFIHGHVRTGDAIDWSFEEPCLTTREARSAGAWLRGVADGTVAIRHDDAETFEELEWFTEPNLALSLASRTSAEATIRVHLSLESRPPGPDYKHVDIYAYFVAVRMPLADVGAAADVWERELMPFPER
jgi:hypothetical protein